MTKTDGNGKSCPPKVVLSFQVSAPFNQKPGNSQTPSQFRTSFCIFCPVPAVELFYRDIKHPYQNGPISIVTSVYIRSSIKQYIDALDITFIGRNHQRRAAGLIYIIDPCTLCK